MQNGNKCNGDNEYSELGESYTDSIFENDVIWMTLDMASYNEYGLLLYQVNDKDFGIAFDKIDINKTYRMALSLKFGDELQLLELISRVITAKPVDQSKFESPEKLTF